MNQKPLILRVALKSKLNEDQIHQNKQLKNIKEMTNTTNINPSEENTFNIGFYPPDGMRWDLYGNPEFIED